MVSMRKLPIATAISVSAALLLFPLAQFCAAQPIGKVCGPATPSKNGGSSSPVDMTGANFFLAAIGQNYTPVTVTNSANDSFKQVKFPFPNTNLIFAYAYNVSGTVSETFNVSGNLSQAQFCVYGFANMPTTDPFTGMLSANGPQFVSSLDSGALTLPLVTSAAPSSLVVTGLAWSYQAGVTGAVAGPAAAFGSGPSLFANAVPQGVGEGVALAYAVDGSGAAAESLDPIWTTPVPVGMFIGSLVFAGPSTSTTTTTTPPPPPPPPPPSSSGSSSGSGSGRFFGPCSSPADLYYNSPVNTLPVEPTSNARIASLGAGRLSPNPEFLLNVTDGTQSVPASSITWDETNGETDGGNYPLTQSSLVSNYIFPTGGVYQSPTVAASPAGGWGGDAHVLMLNTTNCDLYEIFALQSNAPPYHAGAGSIINTSDYNLRTVYKLIPPLVDTDGLDNGTASGMPIWPMVLTHAEVFGNKPITHGVRVTFNQTQGSPGYQWPATHAAGGRGSSGIYMGATFRLKSTFDTTTCHNGNPGAVYPPWFQQVLYALQTYGIYNADYGYPGLISTDAVADWGDPSSTTSDNWAFAGWLHCVQLSDLEQVDNTPRVINVTSGQVNLHPTVR